MISSRESAKLLDKLCVELGFCLPPDEYQRLVALPPVDVIAFTEAVLLAEGLNPEWQTRQLYRQVRDYVDEAFQKQADVY